MRPRPAWVCWAVMGVSIAGCAASRGKFQYGRLYNHQEALFDEPIEGVDGRKFPGDAVILSQSAEVRFLSDVDPAAGWEMTVHRRIQILKPAGRHWGRLNVGLDYWSELQEIGARSYDAHLARDAERSDDRWVAKGDPRGISVVPLAGEGVLYSDSRAVLFDAPGVDPGRVVETLYTVRSKSPFGLADWVFDAPVNVMRSSFAILAPKGWKLRWGMHEKGAVVQRPPKRELDADDQGEWLVWRFADLDPVEEEIAGLNASQMARRLMLAVEEAPQPTGVYPTWQAVAAFYENLTAGLTGASLAAQSALERFASDHPGVAMEEIIYRFVRDRIRYVAIEHGIGALKPHSAAAVFASRYGDCKDMTTLMVALLRAKGIAAQPALVPTRNSPGLHPDAPSLGAFNHVIVALPQPGGEPRFVDPTAKAHPFTEVPWGVQGQSALVVDGAASRLVTIPVAPAAANRTEVTWRIEGRRFELRVVLRGERATGWRGWSREISDVELRRVLRGRYLGNALDSTVDKASVEAGDDAVVLLAEGGLTLPVHAKRTFVRLGAFIGGGYEVRVPDDRESPLDLGYPETFLHELVIVTPRGQRVERLPKRARFENNLAIYQLRGEQRGNEVRIRREYVQKVHAAPANQLKEWRTLHELLTDDARDAVILGG